MRTHKTKRHSAVIHQYFIFNISHLKGELGVGIFVRNAAAMLTVISVIFGLVNCPSLASWNGVGIFVLTVSP